MSAEPGLQPEVRYSKEAALREWERAEPIRRADVQRKRFQELELRYRELYAVYETLLSSQAEERSRLTFERDRAEEECGRLREEVRVLEQATSPLLPPALADIDAALRQIRQNEAELVSRVEQVRTQNDRLEAELAEARRAEMKAQLERVTMESRLKDLSELLLSHAVELSAAKESLQSSIEALETLQPPLAGELKRAGSELSGGLMRDLQRELEVLTEVQRRIERLSVLDRLEVIE